MPTYEYRCPDDHITEAFQKMTDEPLKKCPTCGKKVERILFAPSIHYKGSGFYSTDYGKGGKKPATEPKSEGSSSGSSESKSDSGGSKSSESSSTPATPPKQTDS